MPRTIALYALALTLLGGAVATVADALVVTDEEQLEAMVDGMTDGRAGHRVDAALDFASPSREPVEVVTDRGRRFYEDGDEVELAAAVRRALSVLESDQVELVQKSVDIRGEDARVVLRVRTDGGYLNAQVRLRRHEDRWLMESLRVS